MNLNGIKNERVTFKIELLSIYWIFFKIPAFVICISLQILFTCIEKRNFVISSAADLDDLLFQHALLIQSPVVSLGECKRMLRCKPLRCIPNSEWPWPVPNVLDTLPVFSKGESSTSWKTYAIVSDLFYLIYMSSFVLTFAMVFPIN